MAQLASCCSSTQVGARPMSGTRSWPLFGSNGLGAGANVFAQRLLGKLGSRSRGGLHVVAFKTQDRGASGLDINGQRPTSPGAWNVIKDSLRTNKVKMIQPHEVPFAIDRGVVLIDIRPAPEYEAGHIEGAINVPLYRPIEGFSARAMARRAGFAFFGVFNGTEANPDFADLIREATSDGKGAIVYCNLGGTLDPTATNERGMQSRSLTAAYEMTRLGINNISVLRGGFAEWRRGGRGYVTLE